MNREAVIVGGGISGLVLGYYLAKDGLKPLIIEKEGELGGLGAVYQMEDFFIEHYYHYFLSRDVYTVQLLDELGLKEEIIWRKARVGLLSFRGVRFLGYLSKRGMRDYSSGWDFFGADDLTLRDKYLLAALYLKISFLNNIKEVENISAADWIVKICNRKVYEEIFEPILAAKWGEDRRRISASWLIARMSARMDFKNFFKASEHIGYPAGSFKKILSRLEEEIIGAGGDIVRNAQVSEIRHRDQKLEGIVYLAGDKKKSVSSACVISTVPLPLLLQAVSFPKDAVEKYGNISHQLVVCACLGLKESLSKILNVVCLPGASLFSGIVEHTNIAPRNLYNNQAIVYLFKYLDEKKEEWFWSEEKIIDRWAGELSGLFPSFKRDTLLWAKVSKTAYGDPVSVLGYSQIMPPLFSPIKGLFLTGICRIPYVQDCSNLIRLLREDAAAIKRHLRPQAQPIA